MTGLVYILTNPCLDGWVKIGMTKRNDVRERLKELNGPPNIPLSYQCYATYEVENPLEVEQCVHRLIDTVDLNLHARETLSNGKIRQREFFKLAPEDAYDILQEIATLRGDSDKLQLYFEDSDVDNEVTERFENVWDMNSTNDETFNKFFGELVDKPQNITQQPSIEKLQTQPIIEKFEPTTVPTNLPQTLQKTVPIEKNNENTSINSRIVTRKDRRRNGKRKQLNKSS